jgi:hypothetical protein
MSQPRSEVLIMAEDASVITEREEWLKEFLDEEIGNWRIARSVGIAENREEDALVASCYVDAYQTVRFNYFGETLASEGSAEVQISGATLKNISVAPEY